MALLYALLGKKTEFLTGPQTKIFFARGLAYAQAAVSRMGNLDDAALGFALVAAGRPRDGYDIAGQTPGSFDVALKNITIAWARREHVPASVSVPPELEPWESFVAGWELLVSEDTHGIEIWKQEIAANPAEFYAYHSILFGREVPIDAEFTQRYLSTVLDWRGFIDLVEGRIPRGAPVSRSPVHWDTTAFLSATSSADLLEDAEIPSVARISLAKDLAFDAAFRRVRFLVSGLGEPQEASEEAAELDGLVVHHPWAGLFPVKPPEANRSPQQLQEQALQSAQEVVASMNSSRMSPAVAQQLAKQFAAMRGPSGALLLGGPSVDDIGRSHQVNWGVFRLAEEAWPIGAFPGLVADLERRHDDVRMDVSTLLVQKQDDSAERNRLTEDLRRLDPQDSMVPEVMASKGGMDDDILLREIQSRPDDLSLLRLAARKAVYGRSAVRVRFTRAADRLWRLEPGDDDALLFRYSDALMKGRLHEAFDDLRQAANHRRYSLEQFDCLSDMALMDLRMGQPTAGLMLASKSAASYKGTALAMLAFVYELLGRYNAADRTLDALSARYGEERMLRLRYWVRIGRKGVRERLRNAEASFGPSSPARFAAGRSCPEMEAAILLGDWQRVGDEIEASIHDGVKLDPYLALWWAVSRLRQGLTLQQAMTPIKAANSRIDTNGLTYPILAAYLGMMNPAAALRESPINPASQTVASYFLAVLYRAKGDQRRATQMMKRCRDYLGVDQVEYSAHGEKLWAVDHGLN